MHVNARCFVVGLFAALCVLLTASSPATAYKYDEGGTLTVAGQDAPFRIRGHGSKDIDDDGFVFTWFRGTMVCYSPPCPFRRGRFNGSIGRMGAIVLADGVFRKGRQRCEWTGYAVLSDTGTGLVMEADFNCKSGPTGHLSFPYL